MATIDVDRFLDPISETSRCGENLEYDPAFGELERAARGKERREVGDSVIEAEPPKWPEVFDAADALLERTRDLRVAAYLTRAAVNLDGFLGLSAGLRLIHGLLQTHWDSVHPQLDEDDGDPTLRVNSLVALNDREGLLHSLMRAPLVSSRAAGRFSLRDIRLAAGELAPGAKEQVPDAALIDAAFLDCNIDDLTATADAVKESAAALELIDSFLRERVGSDRAPDFGDLADELRAVQSNLNAQLKRRGVATQSDTEQGNGFDSQAGQYASTAVGDIRSRDDAIRLLDHISEYFRKNEPSSPVPLLLQRAKRLVAKDFMEILRDLTPAGVSQAEDIGGLNKDD
jgi:type VI secretion system protein ImpA